MSTSDGPFVNMLADPLNQLPADPEWVKKCDELCVAAAKELGCMVVMVAVQEGGKLGVGIDGVPKTGPLHEMSQDVPRMLYNLAMVLHWQEERGKAEPKH